MSSQDRPAEPSRMLAYTDQVHRFLEITNSCMDFPNRKPNCAVCVLNTSSRSALTTFWLSEQRRRVPLCIDAGMCMRSSNLWAPRPHQFQCSAFSASLSSRNWEPNPWIFTNACSAQHRPNRPGSCTGMVGLKRWSQHATIRERWKSHQACAQHTLQSWASRMRTAGSRLQDTCSAGLPRPT